MMKRLFPMVQSGANLRTALPTLERALVLLVFAWLFWRTYHLLAAVWNFNTDDAYITLRYARNLAAGEGLVWNVDDWRVEGYSNFLFVVLGAAAFKLDIDPMLALKTLSCAALFGSCTTLYVLARRWVTPLAATLPAILLTSYIGTYVWTVSGLETAVYQFLVIVGVTCMVLGIDAWSRASADKVALLGLRFCRCRLEACAPRARARLLRCLCSTSKGAAASMLVLHARAHFCRCRLEACAPRARARLLRCLRSTSKGAAASMLVLHARAHFCRCRLGSWFFSPFQRIDKGIEV